MEDILLFLFLFILSLLTALLSAATGMGGGVVFLVGLNSIYNLNIVIPIHGLIQLKNNIIRVFALKKFLIKNLTIPFTLGCILGVSALAYLNSILSNKLFPLSLILILVLYSLFKPKTMPQLKLNAWGFGILGIVTGFLGILIGAVDPILSPFFLRDDFTRQEVIANKSYFQSLVHLSKIPVFLSIGFNYLEYWEIILVLLIGGIIGTGLGIKLLNLIAQETFIKIYKSILFLVSIKLAYNIFNLLN